ncbi:response regulator transcription factor [Pedobacter xixiisoli]|uniref:DNA-binding response regulator, OmpR family, contains REC and winged-helix (WHTH) domain n=1 Tax=Pedobacter xixiisoli TaxID=1476464 RepID=A0A285ZXG0_9SPHI|nr:response regulator transcription factor [Pedobacter xixiisoli]SOD14354.1 DNA-binding response regulator, OmpR family, contains REC and winged-helix (wHTH) domain [Pedobacter xixiisoli]
MYTIGLAEDDHKIAALIKNGLEENGYEVSIYHDGNSALQAFQSQSFQLLILDVMMPQITGIDICKQLREAQVQTPILMLTALGTIDDKVNGLEAGADDYLVKPFHFRELLARIEAMLRRQNLGTGSQPNQLTFEDVVLDVSSKEVKRAGTIIELTAKEFHLLELFMRNPNRLLSRQYIAEQVWDVNFDTGTNVVDVYINFLRNKIEKGFERKLIHTKIGMGYIFK